MDINISDIIGFVGVAAIIVTYLLLQIDRLQSSNPWYSILNLVGAILILVSLFYNWNTSAVIIEIFWIVISVYGLIRAVTNKGR